MSKQPRLASSSGTITLLTTLSILLGLTTQIVLARWFGAESELDAYFAASAAPNLITLVLTNSFNIIFVPIFVEHKEKGSVNDAWTIANSFLNLLLLLLSSMIIIGWLATPLIMRLLVPGYAAGSVSYELTTLMFRIQLPIILFTGLNGMLSGIAYAHQQFLRPSLTPIVYSGATLIFTLLLHNQLGIVATAVGSLMGPIFMFALLIPLFLRNTRYQPRIEWRNEGLRQVGKLSVPWIASNAVAKSSSILDTVLTSLLVAGSLTYLNYAYRLVSISVNLVSRGMTVSIFPRISLSATKEDSADFRLYFSLAIRFIGLLAIPASALLIVLREPLIQLLLGGDRFTQTAVIATGNALAIYAISLVPQALSSIVTTAFYAKQNTITPSIIGVVTIIPQAVTAYLLLGSYNYLALSIAFTVMTTLKFFVLLFFLRRQHHALDGHNIIRSLLKTTTATLVLAGACMLVLANITYFELSKMTLFVLLAGLGVLSAGLFVATLTLLKSADWQLVQERIQGIIRKRMRRGSVK